MAFSSETRDWLVNWYHHRNPKITSALIDELSPYVSGEDAITLYRGFREGIDPDTIRTIKELNFTSWSKNIEIAQGFAEEGIRGVVLKVIVGFSSILVDTTTLDIALPEDASFDEEEVILFPGQYRVEVCEEDN